MSPPQMLRLVKYHVYYYYILVTTEAHISIVPPSVYVCGVEYTCYGSLKG
jgi:hypothetical protein